MLNFLPNLYYLMDWKKRISSPPATATTTISATTFIYRENSSSIAHNATPSSLQEMPTKFHQSLNAYLSKIKNPTPFSLSSSKNWILSGCKNPKTTSFVANSSINIEEHINRDGAATLSDIDRFLFENFKSLYIKNDEEDHHQKKKGEEGRQLKEEDGDYDQVNLGGVLHHNHDDSSSEFYDIPPDLCGSHRFFVATGFNSLIEETQTNLTTTFEKEEISSTLTSNTIINSARNSSNGSNIKNINVALPNNCIALIKYSQGPNNDFRQPMQEIVEAKLQQKEKIDWDFVQDLLFCYLDLNEKKSHKFILSAFVDLVMSLRQRSSKVPTKSRRKKLIQSRGKGNWETLHSLICCLRW